MLLRISTEFAILCGGQSRVAESGQPSLFLSRMVEDIHAARIRKANAEFLKGIGGIFGVLGTG